LEACIGNTPAHYPVGHFLFNPSTLGLAGGAIGAVIVYGIGNSSNPAISAVAATLGFLTAGAVGALLGGLAVATDNMNYLSLKENAIYLDQMHQKLFSSPQ